MDLGASLSTNSTFHLALSPWGRTQYMTPSCPLKSLESIVLRIYYRLILTGPSNSLLARILTLSRMWYYIFLSSLHSRAVGSHRHPVGLIRCHFRYYTSKCVKDTIGVCGSSNYNAILFRIVIVWCLYKTRRSDIRLTTYYLLRTRITKPHICVASLRLLPLIPPHFIKFLQVRRYGTLARLRIFNRE